jgi:hypothetical protein
MRLRSLVGVLLLPATFLPAAATAPVIAAETTGRRTVSVADATVVERAGKVAVAITMSQPANRVVTVDATTIDGTLMNRAVAGSDYVATSQTLTFTPGEVRKDLQISVIDDLVIERSRDENFEVRLVAITGPATLGRAFGGVTISDDDAVVHAFGTSVVESGGTAKFQLKMFGYISALDDLAARGFAVDYATVAETATGEDYVARTGTITLDALDEFIRIRIVDDTVPEPTETFKLVLSNPRNLTIDPGRTTAIGTITDDDA